MPQSINRREFIAASAAAGAAAGLMPLPSVTAARATPGPSRMSLIHLFLPGGWPCNDLWDPKPYSPFRPGMRGSEMTSTCATIPSSAPGLMLSERLLITSEFMNHATVVRSLVHQTTDHEEAQVQMLNALSFNSSVEHVEVDPTLGWLRDEAPAAGGEGVRAEEVAAMRSFALTQALIAAVNLVASGSSCARVTWPFEPFRGLDHHERGAQQLTETMSAIDLPIASTLLKLEREHLIDRTIFCISSEFNRTIAGLPAAGNDLNTGENLIIENERDYGFHAHFAEANSIVLFGGPFKRGFVYGRTGPKHPMRVVENPVTLADIHATLAVALGETPREGRVIADLLA